MIRTLLATSGLLVFASCSAGTASSQQDCDAIAQSIREGALKPRPPNFPNGYDGNGDGKPDAIGICTSTDPTIQKDFGPACATLKKCNASLVP